VRHRESCTAIILLARCRCITMSNCFKSASFFGLHIGAEKGLPESQELVSRPRAFASATKGCSTGSACRSLCLGGSILHDWCNFDADRSCSSSQYVGSLTFEPRRWSGYGELWSCCALRFSREESCGSSETCSSVAQQIGSCCLDCSGWLCGLGGEEWPV